MTESHQREKGELMLDAKRELEEEKSRQKSAL